MYELEERNGGSKKGHHRKDSHDYKKQKGEQYTHVHVVEQAGRTRSAQGTQDTIRETQESKENEERQVSEKRTKNKKKEQHDEEEEEDNGEQQEMWEKKREELARMTRKTGSVQSNASDLKGKEYPTFRVSFRENRKQGSA